MYVAQRSVLGDHDRPVMGEVHKLTREREQRDVCLFDGPEMTLLRSIWPPTKPYSNWREDWHSFPLY